MEGKTGAWDVGGTGHVSQFHVLLLKYFLCQKPVRGEEKANGGQLVP
jgi:hypothetical protein